MASTYRRKSQQKNQVERSKKNNKETLKTFKSLKTLIEPNFHKTHNTYLLQKAQVATVCAERTRKRVVLSFASKERDVEQLKKQRQTRTEEQTVHEDTRAQPQLPLLLRIVGRNIGDVENHGDKRQ